MTSEARNGDKLHCLVGTSDDGSVEFHQVGTDVYRVGKGWVADVRGIPMGMRWECSRSHFDRYRASVYSWVLSVNAESEVSK
jgi:hypothetical protein